MSLPCERKGSTKRTMRAQVSRLRRAPQDSNAWRVPLKTMLRKSAGISAKSCGGALASIHHQLYIAGELAALSPTNICARCVCSITKLPRAAATRELRQLETWETHRL